MEQSNSQSSSAPHQRPPHGSSYVASRDQHGLTANTPQVPGASPLQYGGGVAANAIPPKQSATFHPQNAHMAPRSSVAPGSGSFPVMAVNYNAASVNPQQHHSYSRPPHGSAHGVPYHVPNPLGFPNPQQPVAAQGSHPAYSRQPLPAPSRGPVAMVHSQRGASAAPTSKPKVVLSAEAKQALAKAIWSAIKSPTGEIDRSLLEAAIASGLPEHAVRNAAKVAREREAAKVQQQQAAKQQQAAALEAQRRQLEQQQRQIQAQQLQIQQQQKAQQQKVLEQQRKEEAARVEREAQQTRKVAERAKWKRAQHGVFSMQKGRFVAMPYSVGAMVKSTSTEPVLKRAKSSNAETEASLIQMLLSNAQNPSVPPSIPLLPVNNYKRVKIEPKKFSRALDRAAKKSRQGVAETLIKAYKELNKSIMSHQTEFYKFHRQRRADCSRIAKAVRDSREKEEKKKEKDAVAAERARLAALKANDMTAYSKLLEETRNERLKYLLEKTEKHFDEISNLLQQRSVEQGEGVTASKIGAGATSYYASAHTRTEEVRQPSILVGGDLKEYQLGGLQWLVSLYNNRLNGILADEMGLGKTIQAISLVAYLMEFKQNLGPFLVIVPLSTLSNWYSEFTKWCPAARTICYKGTPTQRRDLYKDHVRAGHFNVLLTTYEYIIRDKKFLRRHIWQYAIVDEGHRMKNSASKFAVTLGTQYTTKFRILLTGTPLMNDLSELWSLLNFLLPTIFNSVTTFDQWFNAPFAHFSGSADEQEQDLLTNEERVLIIHRLHELLRPFMLRRVKSEVLDQLPEKVEKVLRCELSSWQKELYKQISKKAATDTSLFAGTSDPNVPSRGLNNIVMQLRKVCNHPFLFSPEGYHINDTMIRSSGKLVLLDQMLPKLKAAGHRILMFTQMTAVMTILEDYFSYRGYLSLRLDGSTPSEEREKRMYKFNAPDSPYFIFLLSTRAGGLGLNLTSADTVIIFDSDWNPAMDLQAQDRAHRIGQRSDVSVFRLITNSPVEEKILSRATEKKNVSQLVVESGQFNKDSVESDNSLERKRLMEILLTDFDAQTKGQVSEKSGSDAGDEDDDDEDGSDSSDDDDLNELLSNNETDYQLYSAHDKKMEEDGRQALTLYSSISDVPDWILHPKPSGTRSVLASIEQGPRKRKDVAYDDGLTERQFMRMMDKQSIAEEKARKKLKIQRGAQRAIKVEAEAEEQDDTDDDQPAPTSTVLTDWTYRKLISCGKTVSNLKDPTTKRRLAEIFMEKPDPATFPDYYEIIEKPIAINDILRKTRAKLYSTIPEFKDDWRLMFANARKFNGDDSWVVKDAQALEKELERVLRKNGFVDDQKPPTCKEKKPVPKKKPLRIKFSLKKKDE